MALDRVELRNVWNTEFCEDVLRLRLFVVRCSIQEQKMEVVKNLVIGTDVLVTRGPTLCEISYAPAAEIRNQASNFRVSL